MADSGRQINQGTLYFSIITGIVLLVVGIFGFLVIRSNNLMQEQVSKTENRIDEVSMRVDSLSGKIEIVRSIARDAEDQARQAAIGRIRAEASRTISEAETRVARRNAESLKEEVTRIREERNQEMNRLQTALSRIADTRRTAIGLVMNLGSDTINFDFDRANLRPENKELLSRVVGVLLTSDGYRVQIFGHTDDIGTAEYNQNLSLRRAESVRDYLAEAGLDPSIITVKGFGKSSPLLEGKSTEARAKNRRVEVGIIDTVVSFDNIVDGDS